MMPLDDDLTFTEAIEKAAPDKGLLLTWCGQGHRGGERLELDYVEPQVCLGLGPFRVWAAEVVTWFWEAVSGMAQGFVREQRTLCSDRTTEA